jgi:hypothetical protein
MLEKEKRKNNEAKNEAKPTHTQNRRTERFLFLSTPLLREKSPKYGGRN